MNKTAIHASFVFCLLWSNLLIGAESEPVKLAGSARFDLSAGAGVRSIEDGQIVAGNGSIQRPNWLAEDQQSKAFTVNFPVSRLGWREVKIRFTPAGSGDVTLTLMGPWEQASQGVVYRQEVLWDAFVVDGARLADGGFESRNSGWLSGGGIVVGQTSDVPAVNGTHYARTWHNQTLSAKLQVDAGKPVSIRVHARAVRPEGFREMKQITRHDTPAHQAAKRFLRGANLGNGLEVPPGQNWCSTTRPRTSATSVARGLIMSASRSAGITTRAQGRSTCSSLRSSARSMPW